MGGVQGEHNHQPQLIGEYLSALSNAARLRGEASGYLVYGIEDQTHAVKGTRFQPYREKGSGSEDLIPWLTRGLEPRMPIRFEEVLVDGKRVVLIEVTAEANRPVAFYGKAFVRVGSAKHPLANHPELERRLWNIEVDWSEQICSAATVAHLDPEAMAKARQEFKKKQPRHLNEVDGWDDLKFLAKARLVIGERLTNAAIILLGKEEAEPLLSPAQAWMMWSLKGSAGEDLDYEHFRTPWLVNVDRLFQRVRNLRIRYLPDNTLFPTEVDQYDRWGIREALHNAIAHQDYCQRGRIVVVEKPDELILSNPGSFLAGSVEDIIHEDVPPRFYRNPCLCQAMVNLGMIDTQGGGIRRMFMEQKKRCFPMPAYDLSRAGEVRVSIPGKVLDIRYTRLLIENPDLNIDMAILLDKVQRGLDLTREQYDYLKRQKLLEGRWGAYHLAAEVAAKVEDKARYIKNRGLDDRHYEGLLIEYLKKFGQASRSEVNQFLLDKLPDVLNEKQKKDKIHNLLTSMKNRGLIARKGVTRAARWSLGSAIG